MIILSWRNYTYHRIASQRIGYSYTLFDKSYLEIRAIEDAIFIEWADKAIEGQHGTT